MIKTIKIKRVYESPSPSDGIRILVDRLWPRGMTKKYAKISTWPREIAPSPELRRWFNHDEKKFDEFRIKYFAELDYKREIIKEILSQEPSVATLVYAARDTKINHAICLKEYLDKNFLKK